MTCYDDISLTATEAAFAQVDAMMTDGGKLWEAIHNYDKHDDAAQCLARCIRNLDAACKGDPYAQDAIKTALHIFQRAMRRTILDDLIEETAARVAT